MFRSILDASVVMAEKKTQRVGHSTHTHIEKKLSAHDEKWTKNGS